MSFEPAPSRFLISNISSVIYSKLILIYRSALIFYQKFNKTNSLYERETVN